MQDAKDTRDPGPGDPLPASRPAVAGRQCLGDPAPHARRLPGAREAAPPQWDGLHFDEVQFVAFFLLWLLDFLFRFGLI